MSNFLKATGIAAVAAMTLGLTAATADAAVLYATSADAYNEGAGIVDPVRRNTANALGAVDGKFLSLGLGGDATFSFGQKFGSPAAVFEVTLGSVRSHIETADVFGIIGGIETLIGQVTNAIGGGSFAFTGLFTQIKFVDTSPIGGGSTDGFDIDAIKVSSVPLPAGGLLLLSGLGGIAALRRRRKA